MLKAYLQQISTIFRQFFQFQFQKKKNNNLIYISNIILSVHVIVSIVILHHCMLIIIITHDCVQYYTIDNSLLFNYNYGIPSASVYSM